MDPVRACPAAPDLLIGLLVVLNSGLILLLTPMLTDKAGGDKQMANNVS